MSSNRRHISIVAVLVAVSTVGVYYLLTAIYQLPTAASTQARSIDQMFTAHFMIISFLFSLIVVFMLYAIFVFRRKPGDESDGEHIHGNSALEVIWTIVPLVIVISFGIWAIFVLADITAAQDDEMVVKVTGQQWSWSFAYPDYEEVGTTNELVVPVDRPLRLEMESRDVIHSFWVPEFRVKQDLVPGQTTILRVEPNEIGEYKVRCAEICGFGHSEMRSSVRVVSEADFQQWLSESSVSLATLTEEERGQKWAADFGCVACHSTDGSVLVGPSWQNLAGSEETLADGTTVTVDAEYLSESIVEPGAKIVAGFENVAMPAGWDAQFAAREDEILAGDGTRVDILAELVAYIESLAE